MFSPVFIASILLGGEFQNSVYAQNIISIVYDADAGGSNATIPLNIFHPQDITVNQSANIKWRNPTLGISYPHTVTFVRSDSNLSLPKSDLLTSSNYSNFIHTISSQNKAEINSTSRQNTDNAIDIKAAILPTVISANGSKTNLDPYGNLGGDGAQYNFTGKEKYVNSGFIWPEGHVPKGFANITSFTVKFKEQGVYHFQCLIHPEMNGTVTVTPPNAPMGITISDIGK